MPRTAPRPDSLGAPRSAPLCARAPQLFDVVGLMFKMGANVRNWLERGFALRLDDHMLFYFRSARDFKLFATNQQEHKDRPAGSICVHGAHLYVVDYVEGRENCFELSTEACPKVRERAPLVSSPPPPRANAAASHAATSRPGQRHSESACARAPRRARASR